MYYRDYIGIASVFPHSLLSTSQAVMRHRGKLQSALFDRKDGNCSCFAGKTNGANNDWQKPQE